MRIQKLGLEATPHVGRAKNWMRKHLVLLLPSLLITAAVLVVGSSFDASAAKKCITIGQKTICFNDGKGQKNIDGNNRGEQNGGGGGGGGDDQGNDDTPKLESKPFDCSKVQCDAGEVTLAKPNKYGACCEPAGGLCPADRPVGTPPNCCAHG